jgi:hypothetical protein
MIMRKIKMERLKIKDYTFESASRIPRRSKFIKKAEDMEQ